MQNRTLVSYSTVYVLIFTAHFSASTFMDVKSQYEMSAENTICKITKKNHVCKSMQNWPWTENFNGTQINLKILRAIVRCRRRRAAPWNHLEHEDINLHLNLKLPCVFLFFFFNYNLIKKVAVQYAVASCHARPGALLILTVRVTK